MKEGRRAYPVVISKADDGFFYVEIPDFDIATQGMDIADAMEMARDAIGLMGIDLMDEGKVLPEPNIAGINAAKEDIVTLVDVDFVEYRSGKEKLYDSILDECGSRKSWNQLFKIASGCDYERSWNNKKC